MRCYRTDETYRYDDLPPDAPHGVEVTVCFDTMPSVRMTMVRNKPKMAGGIFFPVWMQTDLAKRLIY